MCGIVGYVGNNQAKGILVGGLRQLEYRGYDSAGIAVPDGAGGLEVVCRVGKVQELAEAVEGLELPAGCGIGHTRWATHGKPSETNAHPHKDCSGKIAVVHNGIIENFAALRDELRAQGHEFVSETDTETVAHLLERYYEGDLAAAMRKTVAQLQGAYGIAAIHADHPQQIVVSRKDSPIVVGTDGSSSLVASDMVAVMDYTRDVVFLEDGQLAILTPGSVEVQDAAGHTIEPQVTHIDWDTEAAERAGYPDFMLKEIHEQPRVVRDTVSGHLKDNKIVLEDLCLSQEDIEAIDQVYIIGCGTSYHAGLVARELIEAWARIPTRVEVASEFRYRNPIVTPSTLVIALSQSGETADTLAAVRLARSKGAKVFAVTNVMGSRITRESDGTLYVKANMEISVAATKSFLAQIACVTLIALFLAQRKGRLNSRQVVSLFHELRATPAQIEYILSDTSAIEEAAELLKDCHSAMYVGRGINATTCYEGALKLKEISYLHAEAYAAGELKHGPIALLDPSVPVVAVVTESPTRMQTLSNVQEILARGAKVIAIATEGDEDVREIADCVIYIPPVRDCFSAITASVPLQLLARSVALKRGCDVDHPRNLAKSVTVE
ncbi:MAG: glutamine--fructose-6-phosphate transaminase (isomerizing) [Coriobacteriaceae bacterium]|nr:glutamine--fructose-6-phosphate transaminase (isomerizing) [Coriobacteriaceae bacterium]